ncbi:MAG TPA: peptidoglycan DD-metalloendopeptidase family protein [Thermoanaerobaculia bacterium]|nr:peptidoglycan DD-metalloendopeptidase family protein [Thermoanaerobaculia bacterium]
MWISSLCHGSRSLSGKVFRSAAFIGLAAAAAGATTYTWPIGNGSTPDAMNTSFGPRVNNSKWDFHDGVDLPGDCGTDVRAVAAGTVVAAGDANPPTWSSRHVLIKVNDSTRGDVYVYYFHLQSIDAAVTAGAAVSQGQVVAKLGDDDATYCHLHLEFRQDNSQQSNSRHPLNYLPYTDTANFTAPAGARFNRLGNGQMAARLVFGAADKNESDLSRVEVDLKNGMTLLATRKVNFDDKTTINEGNGDDLEFVNDVAVEGYQTSNMGLDQRTDLQYGVVVRNVPSNCDTLVAKVYDLGNHEAASVAISVPNQIAVEQSLNFEDGLATPTGWLARTSTSQNVPVTSIANDGTIAHLGTHSLLATDNSDLTSSQQAAIEASLGSNRFEWRAEGWIRPSVLDLTNEDAKQVYLLHFLDSGGTNLSVSARLRNTCKKNPPSPCLILAGIAVPKKGTPGTTGKDSAVVIGTGSWSKWALRLLRVATRETTAVLYLNDVEQVRFSWDSTEYEPLKVRVGVGQSFSKVKAVLNTDDVLVTEKTM